MIMIVECRRVTTGGQKQGDLAELAWKIFETQSSGGIIVSPLPLHKGGPIGGPGRKHYPVYSQQGLLDHRLCVGLFEQSHGWAL